MNYKAELVTEGFIFPETPRWHRGFFYCCSIDEGSIFRIENGEKKLVLKIDDWLSGWAFLSPDSDEMVLTSAKKRKLLKWDGSAAEPTEMADLTDVVKFGINDLVCTADGVVFVDSVQFVFGATPLDQAPKSQIFRVDQQGNVSVATDITFFPNGMVITPDHKYLLAADSLSHCIHKWELSAGAELINHSIFAEVPGSQPDGICLDEEGGVWFASANKHKVFRVIEGGTITDEVDMGATHATACMLGGDDRRTLLITASDSHDRTVIYANPTGRLFSVQVKVPGTGFPSWYESR